MCEYCNFKVGAEKNRGKEIEFPEDSYEYSSAYLCRMNGKYYLLYRDYEDEDHYIPIEYCPKCGRKFGN